MIFQILLEINIVKINWGTAVKNALERKQENQLYVNVENELRLTLISLNTYVKKFIND